MASTQRVVSLLPSATEIVSALGCASRLIGRSHECDHPPEVEELSVCTRPRINLSGSSAEIDSSVKDAVKDAVAIYEVLKDQLQRLAPDVIVTQSQCDVCAVSLQEVEAAVSSWTGQDVTLVSLEPRTLNGVYKDIGRVAAALEVPEAGHDLIAAMTDRAGAVAEKALSLENPPSVACIEWTDPLMAAGNWVPEMVALAGGHDLFGKTGEHAPYVTWEALIEADPDVIVLMPCGYGLERTLDELPGLQAQAGWKDLKAVGDGRVYATDANAYFNRPGPRLADSIEILAEILHPGAFGSGYEGEAWKRA